VQRYRLGRAVLTAAEELRRELNEGEPVEESVLPDIDQKLEEIIDLRSRHLGDETPAIH
jgi:hypothetical protein